MNDRSTGAAPGATGLVFRELGLRNERVQRVRRLLRQHRARAEEGAFVVEGPKVVASALDAGAPVEAVYVAHGAHPETARRAVERDIPVFGLAPGVIERVATTATPQGVLAVCARADVPMESLRSATFVVVAVDIQDPGNLGTILRSAGAAGEAAVICCGGTVDPYNPKCLRASAGALFHQRLVVRRDPVEVLEQLRTWDFQRLAAVADGGAAHDRCDLVRSTALVLGNEAHGLESPVLAHVDGTITVPMSGSVESLNVAMAATVICFEAARQRRSR